MASNIDQRMMQYCWALAEQARAAGQTAVGSVITRQGEFIAEAQEQMPGSLDVSDHAELLAIRRAAQAVESRDLSPCELYTNAEPCLMCSYAIRETALARVVINRTTPQIGGITSEHPLLILRDVQRWAYPPEIEWV